MISKQLTLAFAAVGLLTVLSAGHPHPDAPHLEEILDGLERGMVALEQLDRPRELDMLRRVADDVRREMRNTDEPRSRGRERQRGPTDRQRRDGRNEPIANQIEILQLARHALMEADRRDAAHLLEQAIAAREMDLHQRRDREAATIRNRAPAVGAQIELLQMASELWREYGYPERAEMVGELARTLARRGSDRRGGPRADDGRRLEEVQERLNRLERSLEEARRKLRILEEQAP